MWRKDLRKSVPSDNNSIYFHKNAKWIDNHQNNWTWLFHQESCILFTKSATRSLWKYNQLHSQVGEGQNNTVFTYDLLALSLPPTAMQATIVRHHNHNQFSLKLWSEDNGRPEPSQFNNYISNMQWIVKEVIHNNDENVLATTPQSSITIRAVSDGSYHPTYQYETSAWIIKIHHNDRAITGANVVPVDAKSQFSHLSELCGLIGAIRNINKIWSTYKVLEGLSELGCNRLEPIKWQPYIHTNPLLNPQIMTYPPPSINW